MVFSLFKKKKEVKSRYDELTIKQIIKETPDAITVVFENPSDGKLDYKAGQYLTCIFDIDGKEERRCYSLNTSPFKDDLPAVTIKRDPNGTVSNYIFSSIKKGDNISILKPAGNFTTEFDTKNKRHLVMVAGGSGITPLMSILQSVLEKEPESFITLIYVNRNEEAIIFKEKIEHLEREWPNQLKVVHVLSQPSPSWTKTSGRLSPELLRKILEEAPKYPKTEYFICGPAGLMEMAENFFASTGVAPNPIHKERFVVEETHRSPDGNPVLAEVTLTVNKQEHVFQVKPGKTILETALDNDIDMPYSCQSGICTTCRCMRLEGEVHMDEDEGLTDEEIAKGYVLICVGRPITPKVKLDADA